MRRVEECVTEAWKKVLRRLEGVTEGVTKAWRALRRCYGVVEVKEASRQAGSPPSLDITCDFLSLSDGEPEVINVNNEIKSLRII